jgi:cyclohexadieny/prephenate dehydrogenase
MSQPFINKFVVVGIGLIGGSLAAGLKQRGACVEVIGVGRTTDTCDEAVKRGVVDRAYTSLQDIAAELVLGDVIFVAVPTLAVNSVFETIKECVSPDVIITDGASVKGSVQRAAEAVFGQAPPQLVLGHPIAGSEKSGVTAANPDLYEHHRVILTPLANTNSHHLDLVTRMWQTVGAEVLSMSVQEHDEVLGATSHLPHVIAYSLVDTLAQDIHNPNIFRYAAGGFRDFTRIASSDPVMWHDIMRANKTAILQSMDLFIDNLSRLRSSIEHEDSDYLLKVFSRAKEARDEFTLMLAKRKAQNKS